MQYTNGEDWARCRIEENRYVEIQRINKYWCVEFARRDNGNAWEITRIFLTLPAIIAFVHLFAIFYTRTWTLRKKVKQS